MSALVGSSHPMHGPASVVLHPDDLHGLPFGEAPNRWMVTLYVMITLVNKVKINDVLCGYLKLVVNLSEVERSD